MCNLSEGIFERGAAAERAKALAAKKEMTLRLIKNGIELSILSEASGWSEDELEKLAEENNVKIVGPHQTGWRAIFIHNSPGECLNPYIKGPPPL